MNDWNLIYQSISQSTASNRGVSYWEIAANCGEKRYLTDLNQALAKEEESNLKEKKQGSFYHGLKDAYLKGGLPAGVEIDVGPVQDLEYANAVRLFNFHTKHFPKDYWGTYIASEYKLPANDSHMDAIRQYFGHEEATGAIDAVYWLEAADVERVEKDRGIELRGPGLYLIDWKTAGSKKTQKAATGAYLNSIQAKNYPLLWNLQGGEKTKGMIFDVVIDHAELRRHDEGPKKGSSIQTFFAPHNAVRDMQARAAINFAKAQRDARVKNNYACDDFQGNTCIFSSRGLCTGL